MIFGHEGLPRSGKSLEAMPLIVDALRGGRTVVTNIAGISHAFFEKLLALPLHTVQRLLICIEPPRGMPEEQVVAHVKAEFLKHRVKDSIWFFDEINQFFPPDRQPLPPDWAKFVTEHGHLGIDVCILGQDLTELHKTWRGRLERYTRFTKLSMKGKEDSYHWSSLTNVGRSKFRVTATGEKKYNQLYWGAYKSHEEGTNNKSNLKDGRFSIFQGKHKFLLVLYAVVLCFAGYYIVSFWSGDAVKQAEPAQHQAAQPAQAPNQPAPKQVPAPITDVTQVTVTKPVPIDYLDDFATQFKPRLSAILDRQNPQPDKPAFDFVIDFLDLSYHVKERMNRADVASLGWNIERRPFGIVLSKDGVSHVVRPWPMDNPGKVPRDTVASFKPQL